MTCVTITPHTERKEGATTMFRVNSSFLGNSQDSFDTTPDSRGISMKRVESHSRVSRAYSINEEYQPKDYTDLKAYFEKYSNNPSAENNVFQYFFDDSALENDEVRFTEKFGAWIPFSNSAFQQKDSQRNYPVLAYALAGNISKSRFDWLLQTLKEAEILSYENKIPLIEIAVIFSSKERFKSLVNCAHPKENELTKGLSMAAYYGRLEIFDLIVNTVNTQRNLKGKTELLLHRIKDENGNSLLHLAVLGKQEDLLKRLMLKSLVNMKNNRQRSPIDEALFLNDIKFFEALITYYSECGISVSISNLMMIIIENDYVGLHKKMLHYLLEESLSESHYEKKFEALLQKSIDMSNEVMVEEFVSRIPIKTSMDDFLSHAESVLENISGSASQKSHSQAVVAIITREKNFRVWLEKIRNTLFDHIKKYIFRSHLPETLRDLASQDGVPEYSPPSSIVTMSVPRGERKNRCAEILKEFFEDNHHQKMFRELYAKISASQRKDTTWLSQAIRVNRKELVACVKSNTINHNVFKHILKQSLDNVFDAIIKDRKPLLMPLYISPSMTPSSEKSDACLWSVKETSFIEHFAEQFDKAHRFYLCIGNGELMKRPDEIDHLASVAKNVAQILPNFSISAGMMGIPLPLSVEFPSKIVIAAIIDLCLELRAYRLQRQAAQMKYFFEGTTLRDRTNIIYQLAESVAKEWSDQINILHINEVPLFSEMAIVRTIKHLLVASNTKEGSPSRILTFLRKCLSNVIDIGPEPESTHKPVGKIATAAVSAQEHLVMFRNEAEERMLRLDDDYHDHSRGNSNKQWTGKGIFEQTGVRTENGKTYAGRNQRVEKYGYRRAAESEARNMPLSEVKPWFEQSKGSHLSAGKAGEFFPSSPSNVSGEKSTPTRFRLPSINGVTMK